jgi:hypothetical protein
MHDETASADPGRRLPTFPNAGWCRPRRPISFVAVHFCDELLHNLLMSDCVRDPLNQLIVVDNRENVLFPSLGAAILHGLAQARNDLVVVVHEDVLLLPGWQCALERSLDALESHDPGWALAGVAGWPRQGLADMAGHWSDPHGYFQLMAGRPFLAVELIDEHLMVLRKSGALRLDPRLPSIHNIGRDLARQGAARGLRTYVVDAPTVHKFADSRGRPILRPADSPKIASRQSQTYLADFACSAAYFDAKWAPPDDPRDASPPECEGDPVILLSRGGGGSRLLSLLALDCGLHLGNEVSESGDTMELVGPVYQLVLETLRYPDAVLRGHCSRELLQATARMRLRAGAAGPWGFKLPELLYIVPQLLSLFPRARFAHMVRDPLATCLRRTHMTARSDNQIGQACLAAAYRHAGLDPRRIAGDSPAMHMAVTTVHQLTTALAAIAGLAPSRHFALRMEEVLAQPKAACAGFARWLGPVSHNGATARSAGARLEAAIDPLRAASPSVRYDEDVAAAVAAFLAPLRRRLGYLA